MTLKKFSKEQLRALHRNKTRKYMKDKCSLCGSKENLEAHHIKPFSELSLKEKLNYDFENMVETYCRVCHLEKIHNRPKIREEKIIYRKGGLRWWYWKEGKIVKITKPSWMNKKDYDSIYKRVKRK